MANSTNLSRRSSGIYFVRLSVPKRLKKVVGKGELHRSTGCRDHRLAKIVAAELIACWHRSIERLDQMDLSKLQAGSVKLLGDGYITLIEAAQECGTTASDLAERLNTRRFGLFVLAQNWTGWLTDNIELDLDHFYNSVSLELEEVVLSEQRLGGTDKQQKYSGHLSVRFITDLLSLLRGELQTAEVCQFLFWPSTTRAFICDLPGRSIQLGDLMVRRSDVMSITNQILQMVQPPTVALSRLESPADDTDKETFSSLCERYFQENKDLWKKTDHQRRKADHTRMFQQLCGDLPIGEINRKIMRDFATKIKDIPSDRNIFAAKFKIDKTCFLKLLAAKVKNNHPGLSEGEQSKVLETISQVFNWAVNEADMLTNPARLLGSEAVRKKKRSQKKAHEQRLILAPADLEKIFSVEWFKNGTGNLTANGAYYSYRPHYYWLPIMALYCGGRLNELCQLYLNDVVIKEEIDCLHFNLSSEDKLGNDEADMPDAADKSLKNISSERFIPIPQILIDLGFIKYVDALRKSGHQRLFPELLFDVEKGYGKYAGKWFNDSLLGKRLLIPRDGKKTFHSMRHNFATSLGAIQANPIQKADLMGHGRKGSTADVRYDKGTFVSLKKLIDKISHPHPKIHTFKIDQGIKAINDALMLKASRPGRGVNPKNLSET